MKRWFWLFCCAVVALVMVTGGLLVPAHLRAVEAKVIQMAGEKSRTVIGEGEALLERKQLGPAQQLLLAARAEHIAGAEELGLAVGNFAMKHPRLLTWGGMDATLERLFQNDPVLEKMGSMPFVEFLVRLENRGIILDYLEGLPDRVVQNILQCRTLTNTVLFPPASSTSGQAMETALALAGLVGRPQYCSTRLREALASLAQEASRGGNSQRFEQALLDLTSLGQRFNWCQLTVFIGQIEDTETLRHLARLARKADAQLPVLFSAVPLSGKPAAVDGYLMEFSQSGLKDLGRSLRYGVGGLKEMLQRHQRLHEEGWREWLVQYDPFGAFYYAMLGYCWLMPGFALMAKWSMFLVGGFFLAASFHFAKPALPALEQPLQVPGFAVAREFLFALGFLLVILLFSEPFLAQESQKVEFPFRLRLPMAGGAVPAGIAQSHPSIMNQLNQLSLLTLLLFFVLQGLIYTACLVKLAEIRRLAIPPRMKLRLLENEDHLFDAGLYLGFVGTIISLILVSLGVITPSLMAAYSSTSFGIIFVSILKIFHVRPLRRKLILESEANPS